MTGDAEIWQLGACGLVKKYSRGELTPVDAVECFLHRIGKLDHALNAFAAINPKLHEQAAESARRISTGRRRGVLEGIPIAVKDNIVAAGMPAAWGSRAFDGRVCEINELPVQRLVDAGALILGKTNVPEFAVEGYTANDLFGVTRNPWNPALTPGGSSGGSAAAVAAGLAPVSIGTDGGGSLRRPAGFTGLFGFKPGLGRVPRGGGLPQLLLDFEVVGPLARNMPDAALLESVIRGADRRDPVSRHRGRKSKRRPVQRILFVPRLGGAPCDPRIVRAVSEVAASFADLGHDVSEGQIPFDVSALAEVWSRVAQIGLAWLRQQQPEQMLHASPRYLAMADAGDACSASELLEILETIKALRAAASTAFAAVECILTPSSAAMPWRAEDPYPKRIAGEMVGPRGHAVYTGWVNASGLPAFAAPAPTRGNQLPIGFQLVGDLGTEDHLFELAAAYERTTPWIDRWPAIAASDDCADWPSDGQTIGGGPG